MEHVAVIAALAAFAAALWHEAACRAQAYQTHLRLNMEAIGWIAMPLAFIGVLLPVSFTSAGTLVVIVACSVSAVSDRQTGYIFDNVIAAGACFALFIRLVDGSALEALAGVAVCGGALSLLTWVTRGRGFAWGDVKLGALLGSLGIVSGAKAIGFAFVFGAACALYNIAAGRLRFGETVPFAPYLAASACSVVVCGALVR